MKKLLLASVALVAATGLAIAAGSAPPPDADHPMGGMGPMGMHGHHHGAMFGALIERYDANSDGSITRAEIDAGIAKDFKTADADHNGKLSSAELKAFMVARHEEMMAKMGDKGPEPEGQDVHKMFDHMDPVKHLDWNLDGGVSLEEFSAPIRLLAMQLDRDGNGTITATDLLGHGDGGPMGPH